MRKHYSRIFNIIGLLVVGVTFFVGACVTHAADQSGQPSFLITWRAVSTVPVWYQGKALPTYQTPIIFSLTIVQNGKIVPLGNQIVKWFVNNTLVGYQPGLGAVTFINKNIFSGGELDVKVSVQVIDPVTGASSLQSQYFTIPVVYPKVVLQAPPFSTSFSGGQSLDLVAVPFFFNAQPSSLSFSWSANGATVKNVGDPWHLLVQLSNQAVASAQTIGVTVSNPFDSMMENGSAVYSFSVR